MDLAFLDISLPSYQSKNLYTSNDLAKLIKIYFSACKIILLTMHKEPITITRAIQEINPKGFILEKWYYRKGIDTCLPIYYNGSHPLQCYNNRNVKGYLQENIGFWNLGSSNCSATSSKNKKQEAAKPPCSSLECYRE